jgi:hypothetical protein
MYDTPERHRGEIPASIAIGENAERADSDRRNQDCQVHSGQVIQRRRQLEVKARAC